MGHYFVNFILKILGYYMNDLYYYLTYIINHFKSLGSKIFCTTFIQLIKSDSKNIYNASSVYYWF